MSNLESVIADIEDLELMWAQDSEKEVAVTKILSCQARSAVIAAWRDADFERLILITDNALSNNSFSDIFTGWVKEIQCEIIALQQNKLN